MTGSVVKGQKNMQSVLIIRILVVMIVLAINRVSEFCFLTDTSGGFPKRVYTYTRIKKKKKLLK